MVLHLSKHVKQNRTSVLVLKFSIRVSSVSQTYLEVALTANITEGKPVVLF